MTPAQLAALLDAAHQPPLSPDGDPYEALDRIEAACEADHRAENERAFGALLRRVEAVEGLSPVIDGVRREALVRWDSCTVTFTGHDVHSGAPVMLRTLHPHADPRRQRWLARQARGLSGVRTPAAGTLVIDLPGRAVTLLREHRRRGETFVFCRDDGSWSAPSRGSAGAEGWRRTSNEPSPPPKHGFSSQTCASSHAGSQDLENTTFIMIQTLIGDV